MMARKVNPFKFFYRRIQHRGLAVTVTVASLEDKWNRQGGRCAITGLAMGLPNIPNDSGRTCRFDHALNPAFHGSVDRIDSSKDYTDDNVQFVCRFVNLGKSESTDTQAKEFVDALRTRPPTAG